MFKFKIAIFFSGDGAKKRAFESLVNNNYLKLFNKQATGTLEAIWKLDNEIAE
jgi:hypothetical protein